MKNQYLFQFFIVFFLVGNIFGLEPSEKPEWIKRHQEGQEIKNADRYYYGIGNSNKSQEDADAKARREFVLNVEVKVKSVFVDEIKERNRKASEYSRWSNSQVSEICLRGIGISERYHEDIEKKILGKLPMIKTQYYSLIQIRKEEYGRIVVEEIKRSINLREHALEEEIAEQRLNTRRQEEALIQKKERVNQERIKESIKEQEHDITLDKKRSKLSRSIENVRNRMQRIYEQESMYRDFLDQKPPFQVLSMCNGELLDGKHGFQAEIGVYPFSFERLFYAYHIRLLEFGLNVTLDQNRFDDQDFYIKLQLLPNKGKFWKTSLAFGYVEYLNSMDKIQFNRMRPEHSPFIAMNITMAPAYHSYLSLYGDFRKTSVGINNFALYRHFQNNIGFLIQCDFIYDKDFRNRFNDPVLFQAGVRFKATNNLSFTLAYEKHEIFTFSALSVFGRNR